MSGHHKPPPRAETIIKAQAGDKLAINSLIRMSMWIVDAQVRRWALLIPDESPEDLTQMALAGSAASGHQFGGVMRAIQTYNAEKGNSFWTHVTTWVLAELRRTYAAKQREGKKMPGYGVEAQLHDKSNLEISEPAATGHTHMPYAVQLPAPDDPEAAAEARMQLAKLSRLPDKMRMALAMRVSEAEFTEMGEAFGVSRQYATRVYRRALSMARLALQGPRA